MAKKIEIVEGLESVNVDNVNVNEVKNQNPNFSDKKWLEENEPIFGDGTTSAKYDAEREPKVQEGLKIIRKMLGEKINPLVLLFGKHWENKVARSEIKKMIDAEAESKSMPADHYLQVELRKNVDDLAKIQNSVDRLRYAITYFKPRAGLSNKVIMKQVTINGELYNVPMAQLADIKAKYPDPADKAKMVAEVIAISTKIEIDTL
ncbi:hypothetical protein M0Q97_12905 [Candidatus Dojkabacteria bacterium]|jgi:hypothetical protein|nr:hypothetical protein [Candidatus Dojkabacteria bacterium]